MGNSENNIPPQTNSSNDDLLEQNLPLIQNIQPSVPSNSQNGIEPNVQIANQSINYIQPSQALQQPQLPNNVYVQCNSIYPNVPTNSQDPPTYEQSMDTSAILALPEKNSQVLTPVIPQPQPQPQQQQQSASTNLNTIQNIIPSDIILVNNSNNTLNVNTKKENYNNDISLKKNNENKKDKKIEDDNSSRDKENKTNDNKAKNNDIEKYLEKETTHTIAESIGILNNTIEMLKCGICLDILLDPKIVEPCGHSFCNHCLRMLQTRVCPLCRTRIHDYHSSILLNELSELIAKYSLDKEQLEERNQCCHEIEEKDKHLNDECMRLMELMELAHQSDNTNNYSVQFHELVELNETDDDI